MQWILRSDVERLHLLNEEARLTNLLYMDSDGTAVIPEDLVGVNLEVALADCYDRMTAIGASSAETRALKILTGLGFTESMIHSPTNCLRYLLIIVKTS
jgi:ATP-binding cassette subfamily F protein 1